MRWDIHSRTPQSALKSLLFCKGQGVEFRDSEDVGKIINISGAVVKNAVPLAQNTMDFKTRKRAFPVLAPR